MTTLILQITAFLAVDTILAVIAWIGYIILSTTSPEPISIGKINESKNSPKPKKD